VRVSQAQSLLQALVRQLRVTTLDQLPHYCDDKDFGVSKQAPAAFIELGFEHPASSISECTVEMQDGCGAKIRMHFRGSTDFDLLEQGKQACFLLLSLSPPVWLLSGMIRPDNTLFAL
jgi:hypothetical protein